MRELRKIRSIAERIFRWVGDMKIAAKILLCMLSIDVMLTIFICIFTGQYFNKLYYDEVELQMQDTMNVISKSLTNLYDTFLTNMISFTATPAVQEVVVNAQNGTMHQNQDAVQMQMSNLVNSNSLIDSVFLVNRDGTYYTMYSYIVRPNNSLSHFLDSYGDIQQITWFPNCQSPFLQQQDVIPIVIPLSTISPGNNVVVAGENSDADTRLVVLLNLQKFQDRLSLSNTNYFERTYFMVNSDGVNISLKNPGAIKSVLENPNFLNGVKANNQDTKIRKIADFDDDMVYSRVLPFSELQLISVLSKASLNAKIAAMNRFIVLMGAAGLVFSVIFSLLLSRFVTAPLKCLMKNIHKIQDNEYDTPYQMKYRDEIGQLNSAVNTMYDTIQSQIRQIKDEEHEKYQLEIQLLAEQINPHLLYNTLEGINLEVLNDHTLIASSMINNLGTFMRIGLNYGDELILIANEIAHVEAYINIMNHRLNKCIAFRPEVRDGLENHKILKLILQPLAENAIKHGFREALWGEAVCLPAIDILVYRMEQNIRIEVIDNGCGIDVDKAKEAVYCGGKTEVPHIGLHNIYARLKIYYGEITMEFETIPYFRNTVILTIPDES